MALLNNLGLLKGGTINHVLYLTEDCRQKALHLITAAAMEQAAVCWGHLVRAEEMSWQLCGHLLREFELVPSDPGASVQQRMKIWNSL